MDGYALGKDIQQILSKLDSLSSRPPSFASVGGKAPILAKAPILTGLQTGEFDASRLDLNYLYEYWNHDYMVYRNTRTVVNSNGDWSLEVDARNESNYQRYYVWYGFYVYAVNSGIEAFRVKAWEGYYGAGYPEVKSGSGNSTHVRDYYNALNRGEFYLLPYSTIQEKD